MIQHLRNRQARRRGGFVFVTFVVGFALMLLGCKGDQQKPASSQPANSAPAVAAPNPADFDPPANVAAAAKVDGKRAIQYAQEIVNFGPRPIGSETHSKVEDYIKTKLQGLQIEEDKFTANTTAG